MLSFSWYFNGKTEFNYVLFEGKEKVIFNIENLSNVSFMNTDLTGVRFRDKARWRRGGGGKKVKEGKYRYVSTQLKDELQVCLFSSMKGSCHFFSFVFWKE